jgi:hypothetical protein
MLEIEKNDSHSVAALPLCVREGETPDEIKGSFYLTRFTPREIDDPKRTKL